MRKSRPARLAAFRFWASALSAQTAIIDHPELASKFGDLWLSEVDRELASIGRTLTGRAAAQRHV